MSFFAQFTPEQMQRQYLANARVFRSMYKKAKAMGKKVNGYTAEQLKAKTIEFYQYANPAVNRN